MSLSDDRLRDDLILHTRVLPNDFQIQLNKRGKTMHGRKKMKKQRRNKRKEQRRKGRKKYGKKDGSNT
jgi:hypothetical protein